MTSRPAADEETPGSAPEGRRPGLSRRGAIAAAGSAGVAGAVAFWLGSEQGAEGAVAHRVGEAGDEGRDFPISAVLPSSYRAGRDDIAPFIRAALDRLVPLGRASVLLPPGRHLWDSPCHFAADTTELTYEVRGHGRGTTVELGPGLRDGFAIELNADESGDQVVRFPRHPRLRVTDLYVTAASRGLGASLCRFRQASVDVQRVRFRHVKYGITGDGYTDLIALRHISWELPADGGSLYRMDGVGGDGLVLEQVTATADAVVADLTGCNGATISSCIGGRYVLTDCDAIEFLAPHFDSKGLDETTAAEPFVLIRSSRVAFRGGWDHVGPDAAAFEIDDSTPDRYSEVTWDGYSFCFRASEADKERAPDVHVRAVQPATRLRFGGCSGRLLPTGQRERWPVGPILVSDDADVQAAIDSAPTAAVQDAVLVRTAGGWAFETATASEGPVAPPSIDRCRQIGTFPGDFGSRKRFAYTVAVGSSGSGTATATVEDPARAISVDVTVGRPRAGLRIWRGPRPGEWNAYVELPVGAYATRLVDTGDLLCGKRWTRGSIPAPPGT